MFDHRALCVYLVLQPRILDEYSDPFDVKKEIEQVSSGVTTQDTVQSNVQFPNITHETPQASEDDYSVPYELKISDGGGKVDIFEH